MPKVKPISPFYDENSAPPAFPSLLTDQLELFGNTHHTPSLLADEILPPESKSIVQIQNAPPEQLQKMGITLSSKQGRAAPSPSLSPYPMKPARQSSQPHATTSHDRAGSASPSEHSSSESLSETESTSTTLSEQSKIPKPPGEPGRPGRGGYNLESTLDWNHKIFAEFKSFIHKLVDEHLDTTKCASAQKLVPLKVVRDKAMEAFPDLDNYANCWPVTDLIMMRLKYTSSRARRRELEFTAGKARRFPASK